MKSCGIEYLADLAPVSIMCFDCDGIITYVNQWHIDNFAKGKKTREEYIGRCIVTLPGIINSGLCDKFEDLFNGNGFNAENVYTSEFSGGHSGYQNIRAMPVKKVDQIVGGIITREDTTNNVLKSIETVEHSKVVEGLLNATEDSVILIDLSGKFLALNQEAARRRSKTVQELLGLSLYDYLDSAIVEKRRKTILQVTGTKQPQFYEEIVGGKTYYVSVYPVFDMLGNVKQLASYSRDKTVQKNYELDLIKAKNAAEAGDLVKTQFLANMSHELRTPLNGILGLSQLALCDEKDTPEYENYKMIYDCGHKLLNIINNILELSDVSRRAIEPVVKEFDLKELIISIKKSFVINANLSNNNLGVVIAENVPVSLTGDEYRLRQIIANIIDNSLKYTSNGHITITISLCENYRKTYLHKNIVNLLFQIEDNGVGIDETFLEKIFDSFYIAENYLTKQKSGVGIGLSIVKSLIEILGGSVDATSKKGEGTKISFVLPFIVHNKIHRGGKNELFIFTSTLKNKTILVVEDDEINLLAISTHLKKMGFKVLTAGNGIEALNVLRDNNTDLIIMDIQMPEMDGLETTHHIRNGEIPAINRNIPIIALTAYAMESDRRKFIEFGMNDFIPKPFDVDHLYKTICSNITV